MEFYVDIADLESMKKSCGVLSNRWIHNKSEDSDKRSRESGRADSAVP